MTDEDPAPTGRRAVSLAAEAVHGFVVLDKPSGLASNPVTRRVQRLFGARSAGHLGTLDPFATGVLVVMFGDATRLAPWLEGGEKVYLAELLLGTTTDTLDRDGAVVATRPVPPDALERLRAAVPRFLGTLCQRVPDYSAAKVDGVRRADLARRGIAAAPKFKDVVVRAINLDATTAIAPSSRSPSSVPCSLVPCSPVPCSVRLTVACGSGTYVRQLVADLGEAVGCGAHTIALRRLRVGPFGLDDAVDLERLEALAPEARAAHLVELAGRLPGPLREAGAAEWTAIEHGRPIDLAGLPAGDAGAPVFVVRDGRVRAVGEVRDGRIWPRRVLAAGVPLR